jgi:hypothetical protein
LQNKIRKQKQQNNFTSKKIFTKNTKIQKYKKGFHRYVRLQLRFAAPCSTRAADPKHTTCCFQREELFDSDMLTCVRSCRFYAGTKKKKKKKKKNEMQHMKVTLVTFLAYPPTTTNFPGARGTTLALTTQSGGGGREDQTKEERDRRAAQALPSLRTPTVTRYWKKRRIRFALFLFFSFFSPHLHGLHDCPNDSKTVFVQHTRGRRSSQTRMTSLRKDQQPRALGDSTCSRELQRLRKTVVPLT